MKWRIIVVVLALALVSAVLAACGGIDSQRAQQQRENLDQAGQQIGNPDIINFTEMRLVKQLYELRDKDITTYAYLQSMDGSLRCLGEALGYGIPYSAHLRFRE